jgi:type II secretory pathway predicted ATPase ExeA
MDASNAVRQEARKALHVYISRTGFGLRTVAEFTGYAYQTLRQFSSSGRFGDRDGLGEPAARKLLEFFAANPATLPDLPGNLYESEATRTMDAMLASIRRGRWGTLYGPAGAQKTFLLEYRAAEAAREPEPWLVYIRASASGMSPTVLLSRIARALSVPYAQSVDAVRQNLLYVLRRRKAGVAVALDEAQHLYSRIDTLETLREIGDLAGNRMGILVAGNEQVLDLFEPRRKVHFEQWRSRIQQLEECVLGPSRAESRRMILGELPGSGSSQVEAIIDGCEVKDPKTGKTYVNARRLFNTLRDLRDMRADGKTAA